MTTTALYEIETKEGDGGTTHPVEQLWIPGEDAVENCSVVHRGLYVSGIDDHGCGCEWADTWRMVWALAAEPGAAPITAMRHPAAPATAAGLPNPDEGAPATWAA
ncbi:hypothetical protein ABZ769_28065 [Streptomyces olivoreticuli]